MMSRYQGVESRNSAGAMTDVSVGEMFWIATVIPGSISRDKASIQLFYGKRIDIFFIFVVQYAR
jgi:hypothetical protein